MSPKVSRSLRLTIRNRREFGDEEEAFQLALDWQHKRLLAAAAEAPGSTEEHQTASANNPKRKYRNLASDRDDNVPASVGSAVEEESAEGGDTSGAGRGTYVAFASHGNAHAARGFLVEQFSATSLATVAHDRQYGACFLVHASAAEVDALLLDVSKREEEDTGGDAKTWPLEALVALPSTLKIAPSMFNHLGSAVIPEKNSMAQVAPVSKRRGDQSDGEGDAGTDNGISDKPTNQHDGHVLTTTPGKAVNQHGLIVSLSPGSVTPEGKHTAAERWRREWGSPVLDLHSLSFWSDQQNGAAPVAVAKAKQVPTRANDVESRRAPAAGLGGVWGGGDIYEAAVMHVREWVGAARVVHALADSAGVTPADACGWDRVGVAPEAPGLMIVGGERFPR